MSEQFAIDFQARARATDRGTAHAAAAKVDGAGLALKVLDELRTHGPGTSHDIAERLGLSLVTVSPRMRPLERKHLVRDTGKRDGRTVWEAV
jgi:DNA-binding transcriptional ArsR family regulator